MQLTTEMKTIIKALIESSNHINPSLQAIASKCQVMPLFAESSGWFGMDLDGQIVSASWETPSTLRVELEERLQNLVLFQGIRNFPELSSLMPIRTEQDYTCPDCKGSGIHPLSHLNIGCYCGGLGWLPNASRESK